jgi:predicted transposase YbfD/YdcC
MEADFPFARTLIVLHNDRTVKKTGQTTTEPHYYLSSAPPDHYNPADWLTLIRGHWGGVEIRNHWRRDTLMGEDGSRSRNPNLLANLALLRSALLTVLTDHFPDRPLPQIHEQLHSRPSQCLDLLCE